MARIEAPERLNLRARCNWALGISSQGYSGGAFCVRPEAPPETNAARMSG